MKSSTLSPPRPARTIRMFATMRHRNTATYTLQAQTEGEIAAGSPVACPPAFSPGAEQSVRTTHRPTF
jgi:hypothetical protein